MSKENSPLVRTFVAIRDKLEQFCMNFSMALLIALAVVVFLGVIFRKLGHSLIWYDEVASQLLAWLSFFGSCVAACKSKHLVFSGLLEKMPMSIAYFGLAIQRIVTVAFFAAMAVASWQVLELVSGEYLITVPWLPREVTQSVLSITCAFMAISEIVTIPDACNRLQSKKNLDVLEIEEAIAEAEETLHEGRK